LERGRSRRYRLPRHQTGPAYAELTNPTPAMAPGSGEQIAGFGTTPPQLPSQFNPARTAPPGQEPAPSAQDPDLQGAGFATLANRTTTTPLEEGRRVPGFGTLTSPLPGELGPVEDAGDGLGWNVAAGFEQGAYDILGPPPTVSPLRSIVASTKPMLCSGQTLPRSMGSRSVRTDRQERGELARHSGPDIYPRHHAWPACRAHGGRGRRVPGSNKAGHL
jgi:hypothetical protein